MSSLEQKQSASGTLDRPAISVLILTLDEEVNIAACIESVPWRQDVWVLDSGSSDATRDIARALGAHVEVRPFTDYADQRNHALSLPVEGEWIVMLDADERMTPELAREIEDALAAVDDATSMFLVRRRDIFMGRWLRRSSGYPTWFPRVLRRGAVRVARAVNETYAADGASRPLLGHLDHYPFAKGMEWWFERHNRYSTLEAKLMLGGGRPLGGSLRSLLAADPLARRSAAKRVAYALPGRPFLVFAYLYIVRLGFLDGTPGFHFACMRLAYEIMIDAKARALRAQASATPPSKQNVATQAERHP